MGLSTFTYQGFVQSDWVDYNGHMNDAAYAKAFSLAVDTFIEFIGLDEDARRINAYTVFTLETHLCYLMEVRDGEAFDISVQLLDSDAKRLHVFFAMKNDSKDMIATSEQMLMGIDTDKERPSPFPSAIRANVEELQNKHQQLGIPKQVGRRIGISR
ncbi:thioesterase family protein [Aquibacillus saliphilus]|uniref:thioesterase family protein n=1 Tax=Aquibacillus saliphilus TaxID=1909422 RepID=UPI001CEFB8A8|nr:thioesterase family protein [Aquibacillus saliphilus]